MNTFNSQMQQDREWKETTEDDTEYSIRQSEVWLEQVSPRTKHKLHQAEMI